MKHSTSKWSRRAGVPLVLVLAAGALAACAPSSSGETKQDPDAEILVWGDATRQPAFEAYQEANPDVKLKFEAIDAATYLSKIQLANKVGKGWPDLIFDPTPNDIAALQSPLFDYALELDDLVDADVQKDFATENSLCTIDGHLYCLQNDLAQDVLWYNKPLLEEFGYELPTTWEEYTELGDKLAVEHPGYVIGAAGESTLYYEYLWASGCPLQTVTSSTEVVINTADEKCTRVATMLDGLIANGSVSALSPFDPKFNELAAAGNLLMLPGPSWYGEYIFKPETAYKFTPGTLAAGAMPSWPGEETNWSGARGGGIYVVSAHSKNIEGAVAAAVFAATDPGYQGTAPTYPAYKPAAELWLEKVAADPFYAEDPSAVLIEAADKINPATAATRYPIEGSINATVVEAVKSGQTIESALPALQTQLASLAASSGYSVSDK
jgi:ABC-type glycerol-3-phosphate transport system substrate-binding protein